MTSSKMTVFLPVIFFGMFHVGLLQTVYLLPLPVLRGVNNVLMLFGRLTSDAVEVNIEYYLSSNSMPDSHQVKLSHPVSYLVDVKIEGCDKDDEIGLSSLFEMYRSDDFSVVVMRVIVETSFDLFTPIQTSDWRSNYTIFPLSSRTSFNVVCNTTTLMRLHFYFFTKKYFLVYDNRTYRESDFMEIEIESRQSFFISKCSRLAEAEEKNTCAECAIAFLSSDSPVGVIKGSCRFKTLLVGCDYKVQSGSKSGSVVAAMVAPLWVQASFITLDTRHDILRGEYVAVGLVGSKITVHSRAGKLLQKLVFDATSSFLGFRINPTECNGPCLIRSTSMSTQVFFYLHRLCDRTTPMDGPPGPPVYQLVPIAMFLSHYVILIPNDEEKIRTSFIIIIVSTEEIDSFLLNSSLLDWKMKRPWYYTSCEQTWAIGHVAFSMHIQEIKGFLSFGCYVYGVSRYGIYVNPVQGRGDRRTEIDDRSVDITCGEKPATDTASTMLSTIVIAVVMCHIKSDLLKQISGVILSSTFASACVYCVNNNNNYYMGSSPNGNAIDAESPKKNPEYNNCGASPIGWMNVLVILLLIVWSLYSAYWIWSLKKEVAYLKTEVNKRPSTSQS